MKNSSMLSSLKGKLVVSCQAYIGEPLFGAHIMAKMATAAKIGGAVGIRANYPQDIKAIKEETSLPVIGIWKKVYQDSPVYITPTLNEAVSVAEAGADIVALDATARTRPNNEQISDIIKHLKAQYSCLVMADISTLQEGIEAEKMGFDIISTTLSGYTHYSEWHDHPDFELVSSLVKHVSIPVFAEGRIHTPDQAVTCLQHGAYAVVVGSSITRPELITERYVRRIEQASSTV